MTTVSKKAFGKYIRKKREEQGINRENFAKTLFVSYEAVSNWEAGRRIPDLETLGNIADVLGITVQDIYDNSKSETKISKIVGVIGISIIVVILIILKITRIDKLRKDFLNLGTVIEESTTESIEETIMFATEEKYEEESTEITQCYIGTNIQYSTEKEINGDYYLLYSELVEFQFIDMWIKDTDLNIYIRVKNHADMFAEEYADISFQQLKLYIDGEFIDFLTDEANTNELYKGEEKNILFKTDIGGWKNKISEINRIEIMLELTEFDSVKGRLTLFNDKLKLPMVDDWCSLE